MSANPSPTDIDDETRNVLAFTEDETYNLIQATATLTTLAFWMDATEDIYDDPGDEDTGQTP